MRKEQDIKYKQELVSVVLPTYNRACLLSKAIEGVMKQEYENWELIIVDDASVDNTEEVVRKYRDGRIFYYHLDKNRGANYCRNFGVKKASGRYIAFLDSDNVWEKNKLSLQVGKLYGSEDKVAFTFCRQRVCGNGKECLVPESGFVNEDIGDTLYKGNVIDTNTVLIKRECFEAVGGFDEQIPRLQDWELFFRVINVYGYKTLYISECLNYNEIQNDSITKDGRKYVNAIFYFLYKYWDKFDKKGMIGYHVLNTFHIPGVDARDIFKVLSLDQKGIYEKISEDVTKNIEEIVTQRDERRKMYRLLYNWKLKSDKENENLFLNFLGRNATVAIYGLGQWGELLYQELKKLPVKMVYGIDRSEKHFHALPVKRPDAPLDKVDFIIVTVFKEFDSIKKEIEKSYMGEIISIEAIIDRA